MKAIDLLYAYFVSLDVTELTVGQIKALSAPFQLTETNLRSTLSRLHDKGMIDVRKRAAAPFTVKAQRADALEAISGFISMNRIGPTGMGSTGGRPFQIRTTDSGTGSEKKLTGYRFRALYPGFWIRPFLPAENIPHVFSAFSEATSFDLIQCRFNQPPSMEAPEPYIRYQALRY